MLGKERIVAQYAMARPLASTKQDDFVGRVLWALSDPRGLPAKLFAEHEPAPPLDWLEPLAENRFGHGDLWRFGVQPASEDDNLVFSIVARPAPYSLAPLMTLVQCGQAAVSDWDVVMFQLARWLSRHFDDPILLWWVADRGGRLHPRFVDMVADALAKHPPPPPMQALWRLVMSGRLRSYPERFDMYQWHARFALTGLTPTLRLQLRELLTPYVRLGKPLRDWEEGDHGATAASYRVTYLVDWEIVLGTDNVHSALMELTQDARWREALPQLLFDATDLLRDALDLKRELDGADDRSDSSYLAQTSVAEHPQNQKFNDWTALIDLARDAWLATAENSPEQARLEAERWLTIPYPIFKRLAFFAATDNRLFSPQKALACLLMDDHYWLWSVETSREALRLLVAVAPMLDAEDSKILQLAIMRGPPREMFKDEVEPERLERINHREVWLRLAKCRFAEVALGPNAGAKLNALSEQYPYWELADDERDEFPVWMGGSEDWRTFLATPKNRRDLVTWLGEHPSSDTWQMDDWRARCKNDFPRTASALLQLAQQDEWVVDRWREALQAWSDEMLAAPSWRYMGIVLLAAPDEVVKELAHSLSWWLQSISRTFKDNEDAFFGLIHKIMALHRDEAAEPGDDPVDKAINHPVGHVTEAALRWWYRQQPEDGHGLLSRLKAIFTEVCDTRIATFQHGRVLLSAHVLALFRVDGEWAMQHLLPLFDWR